MLIEAIYKIADLIEGLTDNGLYALKSELEQRDLLEKLNR